MDNKRKREELLPSDSEDDDADAGPVGRRGTVLYSDEYGEWRTVPGFDATKIIVSSLGYFRMRIMGTALRAPTKAAIGEKGYCTVSVNGRRHGVHKLVCLAFHGVPKQNETPDHIDRNPSNNCATNLRWATKSEQVKNQNPRRQYRCPAKTTETQDDLPGELWKQDNERLLVSNYGRVQRVNKRSLGKRFTPQPSPGQLYAIVQTTKYVHHLVFRHFCGVLQANETIDHINRIRTDNRASNLRAASKSEQTKNRALKPTQQRTNTMKSPVKGRQIATDAWFHFESCNDAARILTAKYYTVFDPGRISAVSRGGRGAKSTQGWEFKQLQPGEDGLPTLVV